MADTSLRMRYGMLRSTKCVGSKVENPQGEHLGKIEDLIVDHAEGHVAAAIIGTGGFLGMGEKLVAVPLSALEWDAEAKLYRLNVDKDTLKNAPSFQADAWPESMDRVWAADVYSYYGFPPYWH